MLIIQNSISQELNNWLKDQNYSSIFILVDENTKKDCLSLIQLNKPFNLIEIESGEANKNLQTCQFIWNYLLENFANRNSLLINLGGGVITDMGAFCASTFKRGIDFINIPTSLLAMVDASIGGKTGVDFNGQKNMIGLFSEAKEVFIDALFLETLEDRQLLSGFAEVLKHGLIQDEKYFNYCIESFQNKTIDWKLVIEKSIEIKSSVVSQDPTEKGLRKVLNYGHTSGHAFESYSLLHHKNPLLHGEAVILGILFSLKISEFYDLLSTQTIATIIEKLLNNYNFNTLESFDLEEVKSFCLNDKKKLSNKLNFIVLSSIGVAKYDFIVSEIAFEKAYDFILEMISKK
jgi:3-dehydroquinate synthase